MTTGSKVEGLRDAAGYVREYSSRAITIL